MRRDLLILLLLVASTCSYGQAARENITGKISFISSQNVYVRFTSTAGISLGDTLYINADNKIVPALVVRNLSSSSCICSPLSDLPLAADHLVIAGRRIPEVRPEKEAQKQEVQQIPAVVQKDDSVKRVRATEERKQNIRGSISVNSYSDISNSGAHDSQRFRYTFSLNAGNIGGSRFSFETYISFRHKTGEWSEIRSNIFNGLKIYSFSATFDLNNSTHFTFGRKINPHISNIGSIDGIQIDKSIGKFTLGAIAGTRPDYSDYGFNLNLFQYGGYASFDARMSRGFNATSIAFIQQTNNWKTDRRFLYFQQSNTFLNNFYFLGTFEIDLYKLENNKPRATFDLTGSYLLLRYRTGKISVSGSYDARRNVMYYETYKTYLDRILETETRQGYRFDASYRISNTMILGFQSGYRFIKSDPRPSENFGGYFRLTRIPGMNMSASLSGTWLRSNYMNGVTSGLYLSGDYLKGKIQTGIGYHFTDYTLSESSIKITQNIGELSLSLLLSKNMSVAANYEGTFEKKNNYSRLYLQIRLRFRDKY